MCPIDEIKREEKNKQITNNKYNISRGDTKELNACHN
jgi:hypothetical protein